MTSKRENYIIEEASFYDIKFIIEKLFEIKEKYQNEYNILIAPLGSKTQSIAAGLFGYLNNNIILVNSSPKYYDPQNYSKGIKETIFYSLLLFTNVSGEYLNKMNITIRYWKFILLRKFGINL